MAITRRTTAARKKLQIEMTRKIRMNEEEQKL